MVAGIFIKTGIALDLDLDTKKPTQGGLGRQVGAALI
jgi:hypothetical protein